MLKASTAGPAAAPLAGREIVITRPAGTGATLARQVRALGGTPLLLPGLSLRGPVDVEAARRALTAALAAEILVFTSPAAVRFAARLAPLAPARGQACAVGRGTARALARHGVAGALAPAGSQDSEGLLAHPALADLAGRRVALVGAPGGRGVLRATLAARGAELHEIHVYHRVAPRLDRRHVAAVLRLPAASCVLLSSAEALGHLMAVLPPAAWTRLAAAVAVVSSPRLEAAARAAGFQRVLRARSALGADLLAAAAGVLV